MQETQVRSLIQEDPLEKEMATHSSVLSWEMSWTEEPGKLRFSGLQKKSQSWVTKQQQIIKHLLCSRCLDIEVSDISPCEGESSWDVSQRITE